MSYVTTEEAKDIPCPFARTFNNKKSGTCDASDCIAWRWRTGLASDPEYQSAIKREAACLAQEEGNKKTADTYNKRATANVTRNPAGYGVVRSKGYCGLAGIPT